MNGLEISKSFWREHGSPALRASFPDHFNRMAVGLLGHGSECLYFDDKISRDHDWGPSFFVFLLKEDYQCIGPKVNDVLKSLPTEYQGHTTFWGHGLHSKGRCAVFEVRQWLQTQCHIERIPQQLTDWLPIYEIELQRATNGEIWHDPIGEVSRVQRLLKYYPEPVWRKRLALKCNQLQQAGPYQIGRLLKRNDTVTVQIATHLFLKHALHMCFLMRKTYAPFYKWLYKSFLGLPGWPEQMRVDIGSLALDPPGKNRIDVIYHILNHFKAELSQEFPEVSACDCSSSFGGFFTVSRIINATIDDPELRQMDIYNQAGTAYEG